MKIRKDHFAIMFATIFATLLWLILKYDGEQPKSEFATYEELKKSGLIEKGWVPHFLPRSAKNIKEQHDIDTNWVNATFEYTLSDTYAVENECKNRIMIENGFEFKCKYEGHFISIKLLNNGLGYLNSTPFKK